MASPAEDSFLNSPGMHVIHNCSQIIRDAGIDPILLAESLQKKEVITEKEQREITECECSNEQMSLLLNNVLNYIQKEEKVFYKFFGVTAEYDRELARRLLEEYKKAEINIKETKRQVQIEKETPEERASRQIREMRQMLESSELYDQKCQIGRNRPRN